MTYLKHYLSERHLDTSIHTTWVDEEVGVVTFPIWNLSGNMIGYIKHNPLGTKANGSNTPETSKYYVIAKKDTPTFWGLESFYLSNTLFITEGIFDATRLTKLGYSAVACLSNDMHLQSRKWLQLVRQFRPVVAICDNDKAGRKLAKYGHTYHVVTDGGDLGDASENYVKNLIKQYNF